MPPSPSLYLASFGDSCTLKVWSMPPLSQFEEEARNKAGEKREKRRRNAKQAARAKRASLHFGKIKEKELALSPRRSASLASLRRRWGLVLSGRHGASGREKEISKNEEASKSALSTRLPASEEEELREKSERASIAHGKKSPEERKTLNLPSLSLVSFSFLLPLASPRDF